MTKNERDKILEELKTKYPIMDEVTFNQYNINEKLQNNMTLRNKYQELFDHHSFIYEKLVDKYDDVKCKRYDFYRFEHDRNLTKVEVENYYLPADKKLKKLNGVLQKQKLKVDFFKLCLQSIEKLYWRIKTYIDYEKV